MAIFLIKSHKSDANDSKDMRAGGQTLLTHLLNRCLGTDYHLLLGPCLCFSSLSLIGFGTYPQRVSQWLRLDGVKAIVFGDHAAPFP